jgi:hypothetical protein
VARLRRPLQEAGFQTVADHAADVYACACDPALPPADLDRAIAYLRLAVDELAVLACDYRHAADEGARLSRAAGAAAALPSSADETRSGR